MLLQPLHRQLKDENERSKAVLAIMRNAMSRTAKQREVQIVVTVWKKRNCARHGTTAVDQQLARFRNTFPKHLNHIAGALLHLITSLLVHWHFAGQIGG